MKIVAILILGYFALGFLGTGFVIDAVAKKPKKAANLLQAETPPFQLPLTLVLVAGFLALPFLGYRKANKQGTFLHVGPKFWLWGPTVLFVAGAMAALILHLRVPSFFTT